MKVKHRILEVTFRPDLSEFSEVLVQTFTKKHMWSKAVEIRTAYFSEHGYSFWDLQGNRATEDLSARLEGRFQLEKFLHFKKNSK